MQFLTATYAIYCGRRAEVPRSHGKNGADRRGELSEASLGTVSGVEPVGFAGRAADLGSHDRGSVTPSGVRYVSDYPAAG